MAKKGVLEAIVDVISSGEKKIILELEGIKFKIGNTRFEFDGKLKIERVKKRKRWW
jgi:hypothetical protein